jgi:hypothetical protein
MGRNFTDSPPPLDEHGHASRAERVWSPVVAIDGTAQRSSTLLRYVGAYAGDRAHPGTARVAKPARHGVAGYTRGIAPS